MFGLNKTLTLTQKLDCINRLGFSFKDGKIIRTDDFKPTYIDIDEFKGVVYVMDVNTDDSTKITTTLTVTAPLSCYYPGRYRNTTREDNIILDFCVTISVPTAPRESKECVREYVCVSLSRETNNVTIEYTNVDVTCMLAYECGVDF